MNETPRKPFWPESGPIVPQTRQFPDHYGETLIARSFEVLASEAWGLSRCAIAPESLGRGSFELGDAAGRFRSGAPLATYGRSLSRPLPQGRDVVVVSIGLAKASDDAPNVTDDDEDAAAVRHQRASDGRVSELHPRYRLLFDDDGKEAYERVPVARVSFLGPRPVLDPSFVPPTLRLWPGSPAASLTSGVLRALVARRADLLATRATRPLDLRALPPASVGPLLLLSAINEALALFGHADRLRGLHLRELHVILASLLGNLEAIDGRPSTVPPPYTHESPGPGLRVLVDLLLALVPSAAREPHLRFPLSREGDGRFVLTIQDPDALAQRVYLVATGADSHALTTLLAAYAKIASSERLPILVNSAVRGVPVALEFDPPSSLPSDARSCTFRVDSRSHYWAEVLQSRTLAVFVPQAPRDLALSVYSLPRSEER